MDQPIHGAASCSIAITLMIASSQGNVCQHEKIPVCLFCIFWLVPNNTVPATSEFDVSPGFVPYIALGTILLYSVILLVHALRQPTKEGDESDDEFGAEATGVDARVLANLLILTVVSMLAWLGIKYIGFEPAMTVMIAAIMYYVGVRNWLTIGLTAVFAPIVLSMCAWYFFSTQMPGFWR